MSSSFSTAAAPSFAMASSFETVNYGLRPNKTVERRLIFEALGQLSVVLKYTDYRYLGLGALLFVDFVLAHRNLGINDLISIEYEKNAARAQKNAPFGCIKVVAGESSVVLVDGSIDLGAKPTVAWMDYDGEADTTTIGDLEVLCTSLPVGSVVIATVNAVRANYIVEKDGGPLSLGKSLEDTFGALVPDPLPKKIDSMNGFPPAIAQILMTHCSRSVTRSRAAGAAFVPLFNFVYKDGKSPMVTIGGLISDPALGKEVQALPKISASIASALASTELELPILTPRERLILDRLLPAETALVAADVNTALGFMLPPSMTESYRNLYKFYPTFSEIAASA